MVDDFGVYLSPTFVARTFLYKALNECMYPSRVASVLLLKVVLNQPRGTTKF